ncbi:MAG: hypothetical protein EOO48_08525 [Flavobacterium sp.]|nr:MAG: hypothetical protein EOO48_08525 [Flavobacterium sp.]
MENRKILFITYDTSGYYTPVYEALQKRFQSVEFYNTAKMSYRYANFLERTYSFFYKLITGNKLKNYLKYQKVIDSLESDKYDVTIMIRPDLFFDSQLELLKEKSSRIVAYYHDSINEIPRKDKVIHFFDKVFSYEKKDVKDFNLQFLTNFIYREKPQTSTAEYDAFTVMSSDYRVAALKKLAAFFETRGVKAKLIVSGKNRGDASSSIEYIDRRMSLEEASDEVQKSRILVDIHKYGVQNGLTFRVFEAMGFRKKLITTNADIVNYDFYDPNNICVIDPENIVIPDAFLSTPYREIATSIYQKYTVEGWLDQILTP